MSSTTSRPVAFRARPEPVRWAGWFGLGCRARRCRCGRGGCRADGATVRLTESQAQADLLAVLQLCGTRRLRCSDKTRRPSAARVSAVAEMLSGGDFYADEAIAAFAWPLLVQAAGLAELARRTGWSRTHTASALPTGCGRSMGPRCSQRVDAGRPPGQFVDFLRERAPHELPGHVDDDGRRRDGPRREAARGAGVLRLVECVDRALATLIATAGSAPCACPSATGTWPYAWNTSRTSAGRCGHWATPCPRADADDTALGRSAPPDALPEAVRHHGRC